jgi:hypothetical protein
MHLDIPFSFLLICGIHYSRRIAESPDQHEQTKEIDNDKDSENYFKWFRIMIHCDLRFDLNGRMNR